MQQTSIIVIILTSSVLSALLTSLFTYYFKRVDYKNDYYKKIIEKRLDAYQDVERVIGSLKQLVHNDRKNTVAPLLFSLGKEHFENYMISLIPVISKSQWLSESTGNKLSELNAFLHKNVATKLAANTSDDELFECGVAHLEQLRSLRNDLEKIVVIDFMNLHDIESFLKVKKVREIKSFVIHQSGA